MPKQIPFADEKHIRAVIQIVTIARFRRPQNPRRCNIHRYHVWRWTTLVNDPNEQPIDGMKCQCGCLEWTHRPAALSHGKAER